MEPRICPHCGHVDSEAEPVVWRQVYVGGHGYVSKLQCKDQIKCWSRWDKAHDWQPLEERMARNGNS